MQLSLLPRLFASLLFLSLPPLVLSFSIYPLSVLLELFLLGALLLLLLLLRNHDEGAGEIGSRF